MANDHAELTYLDTGEIFETDSDGEPVGDPVATLQHAVLDDDAHALGTKMAAAPALYTALDALLFVLTKDEVPGLGQWTDAARAALVKAGSL